MCIRDSLGAGVTLDHILLDRPHRRCVIRNLNVPLQPTTRLQNARGLTASKFIMRGSDIMTLCWAQLCGLPKVLSSTWLTGAARTVRK